ncbi:MAG: 1,4-alpha-glucan branching protein domain-containing protein [Calditrichota bacterium]
MPLNKTPKPGFALVLHTHIPWVLGKGNWPHGAVWLYEAAAETYIPLLDTLSRLTAEGVRAGVTIGVTPILAEQLTHSNFAPGFREYLRMKIAAARDDQRAFQKEGEVHFCDLAKWWDDFYCELERSFCDNYQQNLINGFRRLQDQGAIEIITSCATHGYLPLLGEDAAIGAQVKTGVEVYRRYFGRDPIGFWLPECAYRPSYAWVSPTDPSQPPVVREGVERFLSQAGIRYFIIDTALLKGGKPQGVYLARFEGLRKLWEQFEAGSIQRPERSDLSPYQVYAIGSEADQPVAVLTRDPQTGLQVWSGRHGYPGDGNYLEFHKKRFPGGHRYWRITRSDADIGDKEAYFPEAVDARLEENATHFVQLLEDILISPTDTPSAPVLGAPYDTELFGHWWFEGVRWLEKVWRKLADNPKVRPVTGSEALERAGEIPRISLPEGSWGEGGFHQIWFNPDTEWCWHLIHRAEKMMVERSRLGAEDQRGLVRELLAALGRELLLLEASDWPFVISTGSAPDYAEQRLREHYDVFMQIADIFDRAAAGQSLTPEDWESFRRIQDNADIFPSVGGELWK